MNIKDKMVYAMVALNGLILSVSIFFILNFLVDQTVVEEKQKIVNQSHKIILSGFNDIDFLLTSLMPHIKLSKQEGMNKELVIDSIRKSLSIEKKKSPLTKLYLIEAAEDQNKFELIYQQPGAKSDIETNTINSVLNSKKIILQGKGSFIHLIDGKNFIIAKSLLSEDKKQILGFLVAFVSPTESHIFSKLQDISKIDMIQLSDIDTGETVYSFSRVQADNYGQRTIKSMITLDSGMLNLNILY